MILAYLVADAVSATGRCSSSQISFLSSDEVVLHCLLVFRGLKRRISSNTVRYGFLKNGGNSTPFKYRASAFAMVKIAKSSHFVLFESLKTLSFQSSLFIKSYHPLYTRDPFYSHHYWQDQFFKKYLKRGTAWAQHCMQHISVFLKRALQGVMLSRTPWLFVTDLRETATFHSSEPIL